LEDLFWKSYRYFRATCGDKPIILEEFATYTGKDQPEWLEKGFQAIKSMPRIKAAIYWNNINYELNDDHTLSDESLRMIKEVIKDPYFIMAK
jgi:hypothetical protein